MTGSKNIVIEAGNEGSLIDNNTETFIITNVIKGAVGASETTYTSTIEGFGPMDSYVANDGAYIRANDSTPTRKHYKLQ